MDEQREKEKIISDLSGELRNFGVSVPLVPGMGGQVLGPNPFTLKPQPGTWNPRPQPGPSVPRVVVSGSG